MMCELEICLDPELRLLICRLHGSGVHPTKQAIIRHLRSKDHPCSGENLKEAAERLMELPLRSVDELRRIAITLNKRPAKPIAHLQVLDGWTCIVCGGQFLTTSHDLIRRHAATNHKRDLESGLSWDKCKLQTFFQETKDRCYFRVTESRQDCNDLSIECSAVRKRCAYDVPGTLGCRRLRLRVTPRKTGVEKPSRILLATDRIRRNRQSPAAMPTDYHPFAYMASKHVQWLPLHQLDSLLKSSAFRTVSEPLFDPSHIDAQLNMMSVFPGCDEEPLFFIALLYSISQFAAQGPPCRKTLRLQRATINLLKEKISCPQSILAIHLIGSIMILKTTAYKLNDHATHNIHSRGLIAVLTACGMAGLTPAAKRALFWQDLYAEVFINSERQVNWQRPFQDTDVLLKDHVDVVKPLLPPGFGPIRLLMPPEILDCIIDTIELQEISRAITALPLSLKLQNLDSMQASIESRLVRTRATCEWSGTMMEATRLAIFICCYCSWMEVWNDSLVPCMLAGRLLDILESSIAIPIPSTAWEYCLEHFLWLLFTVSSAVELDQGHVSGLRPRRARMLHLMQEALSGNHVADIGVSIKKALEDFVYCNGWYMQRYYITEWMEFEKSCSTSSTEA